MRKHLYRKSAWKEGVPSSLNYRSVLSGALYGCGRVGGLTARSSLRRPGRHRLRWEVLDVSLPGTAPGTAGPAAPLPAPAHPAARPRVGRAAGGGSSLPCDNRPSPGCSRSTRGPRLLTLNSRRLSRDGGRPQAQGTQKAPPPTLPASRHLQGPRGHPQACPSRDRGEGFSAPSPPDTVQGNGRANRPHRGRAAAAGTAPVTAGSVSSVEGKRWRNE